MMSGRLLTTIAVRAAISLVLLIPVSIQENPLVSSTSDSNVAIGAPHVSLAGPIGFGNAIAQSALKKEEVSDAVANRLERADELFRNKNYDEAIIELKAALTQAGKPLFTGYLNLGSVYFEKGDYKKAVEAFQQAAEIRSDDFRGHYNLGEACFALGSYPEAAAAYRKALPLAPATQFAAQTRHFLGLTLYRQNRKDDAVTEYRAALDLMGGRYSEAHNSLGIALTDARDLSGAEREFHLAIEQETTFAEAHFNLGACLERQERYKEAATEYEKFLSLRPDYADAPKLRIHIAELRRQK